MDTFVLERVRSGEAGAGTGSDGEVTTIHLVGPAPSHTRCCGPYRRPCPGDVAARPVVFSAVLALAVVTSLFFLDKTAVDRLPVSLMNAVPRFLVAMVFVLLGNAIA